MGEAPLRPSRTAAVKASTPVPMLLTAPSPVMTTRRLVPLVSTAPLLSTADLSGTVGPHCVLLGHGEDAGQVPHVLQLILRDDDAGLLLDPGQDRDQGQGVGMVVLDEVAGVGEGVWR